MAVVSSCFAIWDSVLKTNATYDTVTIKIYIKLNFNGNYSINL